MLALSERTYLNKIYSDEFLKLPQYDNRKADWHAYSELQNADLLLSNISEDELYWIYNISKRYSHREVIEIYDKPIRGIGKGIELDTVVVSKDYKYISDVMGKMPLDVMIYKGKTGVGGTTLAIQDNRKWVICVGSRNVVKSKSEKHNNTLGVYAMGHGGATNDQIWNYKGNTIITTWSSIDRVIENINPKEWSLLLDENQEFIRDGAFRGKDINNVLKLKDKFKHFTLMSATETKREDYLGAIDGMDILRIEWEEKKIWNIEKIQTMQLEATLAEIAKRILEDKERPNVHIFLNKVNSILRVVSILEKVLGKDLHDEISIAASDKPSNIDKIESIGNGNYKLEDGINIKRVNFYTATSFSGVDIEDNNGDVVIAVNGNISYTRLDIISDIPQIIGRIRNPRTDMRIQLVFTKGNSNKMVSREDYYKGLNDIRKDAKTTVIWYNDLTYTGRENEKNKSKIKSTVGLQLIDGKASIDKAYFMNKKKSYRKDNTLYTMIFISDRNQIVKQGSDTFKFIKEDNMSVTEEICVAFENKKIKIGTDFKTLSQELLNDMDEEGWQESWWVKDGNINTRRKWADRFSDKHGTLIDRHPYIKDTIYYFSPDQIREIGLKMSAIKFATEGKQNINNLVMLRKYINISKGVKYTVDEIKEKLKAAFAKIGVDKSVDSTYIKKVYPGIHKKKIRVDKNVVISEGEYRKIKSENYDRSKPNKIPLSTSLDKNGDVIEIYKTVRNGGRQEVYILPL